MLIFNFRVSGDRIVMDRALMDVEGIELFGCDVCWTCKWFNFSCMECISTSWAPGTTEYRLLDQYNINISNMTDNPGHFRCPYWEVENEERS